MFTPKQLQDFIAAPRALAAFLSASQPLAAPAIVAQAIMPPRRKRKPKSKIPPGYDVAEVKPDGSWVLKPRGEHVEQPDNVTEFEAWRARHAVR